MAAWQAGGSLHSANARPGAFQRGAAGNMGRPAFAACVALFLFTAGCSETESGPRKSAEKPAAPVTGQSALWRMYQVARAWAPDAQVLRVSSIAVPEVAPVRGKSGAWEATFTSEGKGRRRAYTYSVVESQDGPHQGVFAGQEEDWSGPGGQDAPFPIGAVAIDTDAAYKTAAGQAREYEKKHPGKPITLLLENVGRYPNPAWRVIWGASAGTSDYSVYVDATTGKWLETVH